MSAVCVAEFAGHYTKLDSTSERGRWFLNGAAGQFQYSRECCRHQWAEFWGFMGKIGKPEKKWGMPWAPRLNWWNASCRGGLNIAFGDPGSDLGMLLEHWGWRMVSSVFSHFNHQGPVGCWLSLCPIHHSSGIKCLSADFLPFVLGQVQSRIHKVRIS